MENTELQLSELENGVKKLTNFERTVEELKAMVLESKKITVTDLRDKAQLEIVKRSRIDLRREEVDIEKQGLGYRRVFTKINKHISDKEKELKAITSPEIERLSGFEQEASIAEFHDNQVAKLPMRKERLMGIDPSGCYICADDYLIPMLADDFESYYNKCVANKNERNAIIAQDKLDKERKIEADKLAKERAELEADKQVEADRKAKEQAEIDKKNAETNAKLQAENDLIAEKQRKIDEANRKLEADKLQLKHEKELKEVEEKAKEKAEEDAKAEKAKKEAEEEAENKRIADAEAERKRQMQKREDYKLFLKKHGFTAENRSDFKTDETDTEFILYKKVGVFIK